MINQKNNWRIIILSFSIAWLLILVNVVKTPAVKSSVPKQVKGFLPGELPWEDNLNKDGIQTAIAIGNPSNAELYVLFNKMAPQTLLSAHTHPDDRITTVISGVMYYGTGKKFEPTKVKSYPTGSVVYTPAGASHFIWAKDGETIIQQTGIGPTEIEFLDQN